MTHSVQEAVVYQSKGDVHYDAAKICNLLNVPNWRTAVAPLFIDAEKIIKSSAVGDSSYILTQLGVKKIITTLPEDVQNQIDPNILTQFGVRSNGVAKKVAAQAAKDKPLEKNTLIGYLRMVFPEQEIQTNWVIPSTETTVDIFIRSDTRKTSIAILCDDSRSEPFQLTDTENQQAFNIKAATAHDIKWLLFKDYKAKRPGPSFFTLIAHIKDILYGPFSVKKSVKKDKKPKSDKKSKSDKSDTSSKSKSDKKSKKTKSKE